ncbi:HNH endonuclease signature motif containing protein [Mycolicibacterium sp. 050232]|uniref:HNH endonuclease signature motif containing protein n=1 Tax=Mycolicibacterium sp. 050232 TaxID=3113982 RepID=UPI002E28B02D|nr:HNH endonuclease signature motif containing protein [Mycolicibacterium sp. 050232]MED5815602.1 HNH endonuclease signature motif containing protein [Mycolicibacterium sp. 050232]
MSSDAATFAAEVSPAERLEVLFEELSELCGQRNAIDGRIVDIVAELERDELCGITGARSMKALVAWKTGITPRNAETVVAVARRLEEFPRCTQDLRDGRLSLDQVGVIAERAADGSDAHYAELAAVATVTQLRTAVKLEPRPEPDRRPEPQREITTVPGPADEYTTWRVRLPRLEAAKFQAALQSHHDALVADWKRDHDLDLDTGEPTSAQAPPFPNSVDAFMSLIQAGWDTDVAARPHGQHTTVAVHLNLTDRIAALHLGPVLTDEERRYLLCDTTCEVWLERHGQPISVGRGTRTISRRLRRALEHRDHCCVVPGCGSTRGLHAHHIVHWEDGGPTDLDNLVLVCPYHHRAHHRGELTITGPAHRLVVTDRTGRPLHGGSLARPPTTPPPDVPPCPGPTGERAEWWWYPPFEPQPPPEAA